jgi:hypothetical protein
MPKYRIELNADLCGRYSMEVEAVNEAAAKARAIETAPRNPSMWDIRGDAWVSALCTVDSEEILESF